MDEPVDEAAVLGPLRSMHEPFPLVRRLVPAITMVLLLGFVGATTASNLGPIVFALLVPCALVSFFVLAWTPFRARDLRVALHARGVVVSTTRERSVMAFEEVDELWMVIDPVSTSRGTIALIRGNRLVDREGRSVLVPTNLEGAVGISHWLQRHCSDPLREDALRALHDGETLTFGKFQLDREGIRGAKWGARWSELSLVRLTSGKVSFFRRQRIIPWRSIGIDQVPHPTVFVKLVKECATKIEIDDPLGLSKPSP